MRRRGPLGVVQVELLEGDADLAVDGADDDGGGDPGEAARARRLRWVGLAVVVALVGTILTATVIDTRHDAARRVELAELGWVLPPIEGPLDEVWRSGGWNVAQTDELIVVQGSEAAVRALDAATGSVLWERDGDCSPVYDYASADLDRYPTLDTLVCVPHDAYSQGPRESAITFEVVAVDVATGIDVGSLDIDGDLLMQDSVDGEVLLTFVDGEAAIGVIRWDPRAGEVWSYRSAPGVLPDGVPWADGWVYGRWEGVLQLTDDLALDLTTGEQVTVPPLEASSPDVYGPNVHVQPLPDGGSVEVRYGTSSDGGWSETGRVLNDDGSLRFEIDGTPWFSWQTDGSDADVLFVSRPDGRMAAIDPGTGRTRWTTPGTANVAPTFVLEDVMVLVGSSGVLAIDVHDGEERWHAEEVAVWNGTAATDGDVVLVETMDGEGQELVALDLRTGVDAWRIPITGSYWYYGHGGGNLLLFGDNEIVALG